MRFIFFFLALVFSNSVLVSSSNAFLVSRNGLLRSYSRYGAQSELSCIQKKHVFFHTQWIHTQSPVLFPPAFASGSDLEKPRNPKYLLSMTSQSKVMQMNNPYTPVHLTAGQHIKPRYTRVLGSLDLGDGVLVLEDPTNYPEGRANLYKIKYDLMTPIWDAPLESAPPVGPDYYTFVQIDKETQYLICDTLLETYWISPHTGEILWSEMHK